MGQIATVTISHFELNFEIQAHWLQWQVLCVLGNYVLICYFEPTSLNLSHSS